MVDKQIIKQFLTANKNLTLLAVKVPIIKDWTNTVVDKDKILKHNGNLGWVIGDCDLVVDVDPKNGGDESFKRLVEDLNLELEPSVNTPSGGFHIYLKMDKLYKNLKKNINSKYKGIDFLSKGTQCVIPSSKTLDGEYIWSDDLLDCFHQTQAPESLIKLLTNHNIIDSNTSYDSNSSDDLGDFKGLINESSESSWSKEKVEELLSKIDASMNNNDWVKVGMALHDWNTRDGLELWEEWSKGGTNYNDGDTQTRWRSFKLGGGVTLGTISHMAKVVDYDEEHDKVDEFISLINESDEKQLEFDVYNKIKKITFTTINKEKIAKAIQDRLKVLTNVKMSIKDVRKIVDNSDRVVSGHFIEDLEVPEWCKKWVYINSHAGFMNIKTFQLHKSESFNIENGQYILANENGVKVSATKFISDNGVISKVDAMGYFPTRKETLLNIDGSLLLNSFNPVSVPISDEEFTESGLVAIEAIKKHIKFICTTDSDSYILTQWLAHQVQHKGKKILWSPVIQSIQGIGKSFFGELLRCCLGDRNVGTVSPSQVTSDFNGWATNTVVNVLEELRVKGHNRFDTTNALKPLITDRMIQINDKGVKQYMAYNNTNYMCFTNYKDSLPLDEDDRRWWVIFAPIQSLSELKDYVGEDVTTYFPKLFGLLRTNAGQVNKWLLEYPISDEFLNMMQAPMTDYKKYMIATEGSSIDGLDEIKELIEIGGKYFCKDVISSVDLFESVKFEYPDLEDFKTTQRNIILKKLGYMKIPNPIYIDGKARRCWSKNPIKKDKVRLLLNNK